MAERSSTDILAQEYLADFAASIAISISYCDESGNLEYTLPVAGSILSNQLFSIGLHKEPFI